MENKESIETQDGKIVRMNKVAYAIASRHFGARKLRVAVAKEKPIELLKMPTIIKAAPIEAKKPDVVPPVVNAPVVAPAGDVDLVKKPVMKRAPAKRKKR